MDADDEQIRQRAYQLWERDGSPHGRHADHWAAAELELANERDGGVPSPGQVAQDADAPVENAAAPKKAPPRPRKRAAAKSPLADAGAPGGTGGTGGTFRDQDQ